MPLMAKTLPLPCVPHCLCCHLAFAFVLPPAFGGLNHLPLPRGPLRTYTKTAIEWMAGHLLECALPDGAGVRGPNLQFGTPRCCSHPLNGVPRIQLWTPDDASPPIHCACMTSLWGRHVISLVLGPCHPFGKIAACMTSLWGRQACADPPPASPAAVQPASAAAAAGSPAVAGRAALDSVWSPRSEHEVRALREEVRDPRSPIGAMGFAVPFCLALATHGRFAGLLFYLKEAAQKLQAAASQQSRAVRAQKRQAAAPAAEVRRLTSAVPKR